MKIETKYNIGQEVWYMEDNHTELGEICGYNISYGEGDYYGSFMTGEPKSLITYYIKGSKSSVGCLCAEDKLFPTKEELLKSL